MEAPKGHYQRGGLGSAALKRRLIDQLKAIVGPLRERQARFNADQGEVMRTLRDGARRARYVAANTLEEVKHAMALDHF